MIDLTKIKTHRIDAHKEFNHGTYVVRIWLHSDCEGYEYVVFIDEAGDTHWLSGEDSNIDQAILLDNDMRNLALEDVLDNWAEGCETGFDSVIFKLD